MTIADDSVNSYLLVKIYRDDIVFINRLNCTDSYKIFSLKIPFPWHLNKLELQRIKKTKYKIELSAFFDTVLLKSISNKFELVGSMNFVKKTKLKIKKTQLKRSIEDYIEAATGSVL